MDWHHRRMKGMALGKVNGEIFIVDGCVCERTLHRSIQLPGRTTQLSVYNFLGSRQH